MDPDAQNIIIVGTTCGSKIIQLAYKNKSPCYYLAPTGKGLIELLKGDKHYTLIVTGRTFVEVQKATDYLSKYSIKSMSGTRIEVS